MEAILLTATLLQELEEAGRVLHCLKHLRSLSVAYIISSLIW